MDSRVDGDQRGAQIRPSAQDGAWWSKGGALLLQNRSSFVEKHKIQVVKSLNKLKFSIAIVVGDVSI